MSRDRQSAAWPALMGAAQDGDRLAYARLLAEIAPVIAAFVRRRIYDSTLAEDVVQDVLLTVHRVRHTYDPARPFLPWLAAIAGARSIDALRRRSRHDGHEVNDDLALLHHVDDTRDHQSEARDAAVEVAALLDTLPPRQRAALELVKIREMSLVEAAAKSALSVPALKALMFRAMSALRDRREGRP